MIDDRGGWLRRAFPVIFTLTTHSNHATLATLGKYKEVVSLSHSRVTPKTWKMVIDILSWLAGWAPSSQVTKLESNIDIPETFRERWLSSGQMLCERLLCPNGKLNALWPMSYVGPSLITVHLENWLNCWSAVQLKRPEEAIYILDKNS